MTLLHVRESALAAPAALRRLELAADAARAAGDPATAREIAKLGPFEILYGGDDHSGIPAVCWKIREGSDVNFNLYALADRLRVRDTAARCPGDRPAPPSGP